VACDTLNHKGKTTGIAYEAQSDEEIKQNNGIVLRRKQMNSLVQVGCARQDMMCKVEHSHGYRQLEQAYIITNNDTGA
jgi:hypothetical protein